MEKYQNCSWGRAAQALLCHCVVDSDGQGCLSRHIGQILTCSIQSWEAQFIPKGRVGRHFFWYQWSRSSWRCSCGCWSSAIRVATTCQETLVDRTHGDRDVNVWNGMYSFKACSAISTTQLLNATLAACCHIFVPCVDRKIGSHVIHLGKRCGFVSSASWPNPPGKLKNRIRMLKLIPWKSRPHAIWQYMPIWSNMDILGM